MTEHIPIPEDDANCGCDDYHLIWTAEEGQAFPCPCPCHVPTCQHGKREDDCRPCLLMLRGPR
jgi:hypothetical protein